MSSFPLEWPGKAPASQRLTLSNRQSVTESTTSYVTQVVQTAAQWQLTWTWPPMDPATAEYLDAWITSLQGQVGTFRYYPVQPYASALTGITLAQQGYQYGTALSAGGFTAGHPTTLRVGQFFQVGTQLLKITSAPANADDDGQATIEFQPMLRQGYAQGTAINFANPCGEFRLNASQDVGYTIDTNRVPEFSSMTAREAI